MRIAIVFFLLLNITGKAFGQVNLPTGSANYGIPVFNWQDEKSRLNSSIGLNYNSGNGLKVDEGASNIGQGWSLTAGGVISRMQVGEPDDQHAVDFFDQQSQKQIRYPDGFLYNPNPASNGCPSAKAYYPLFRDQNVVYKQGNLATGDTEQDYFSFVFNGRSNVFVLDKSHMHFAKVLGDSKLIISYAESDMTGQGIRTTISSFTVEDENGLIYRFSDKGQTKEMTSHYAYGNFAMLYYVKSNNLPTPVNQGVYFQATFDELIPVENPYIISSWYLSEIEDRFTHRKILFNYSIENNDNFAGQTISLTVPNPAVQAYEQKKYVNVNNRRSVVKNPVLSQMVFPNGTLVNFMYAVDQRRDFRGGHALQFIDLNYQGKLVTRFELIQDYFGDAVPFKIPRLYLTGCKVYSSDLKDYKKHVFNYFMNAGSGESDDFIPPVYFECKDSYGYYNGSYSGISPTGPLFSFVDYSKLCKYQSNPYLFDVKPVKTGYAKIGLLKSVFTPTGSSISYNYSQIPSYGGVQVSSVVVNDGVNSSANQTTAYNYTLENGQSSIWGKEDPENRITSKSEYVPETKTFNGISCDYRYKYPGILSIDEAVNISSLQQFFYVFSEIVGYVSLALDIYGIIAAIGSTGQLEAAIVMFIFDVVINLATTCTGNASENDEYEVWYSANLRQVNPLPLQFKRVEVVQTSQGNSNGKTVYEFTCPDDFPEGIIGDKLVFPFSYKPRSIFWAYGLPKRTTVFDAAGNTVSQTENTYNFSKAKVVLSDAAFQSCKCGIKYTHSKNNVDWQQPQFGNQFIAASNNDFEVDKYSMYTGRVELTETDQRLFKGGNQIETKSFFSYNDNNYQLKKITTIQSNEDKTIKEIFYPIDYTSAGVLQTLVSNNVIGLPVAIYESIQKKNSNTVNYLAGSVIDFSTIQNGDIKPYKGLVGRSNTPVSFGFDPSNPFNYPGLIQSNISSYTATGNLAGMTDEGGRSSGYLYDYNDNRIVATVTNANPIADKIAYTSFETEQLGGWVMGGNVTIVNNTAVTGNKYLSLSAGNSLTTSVTSTKSNIVSFWSTAGLSVSAGATLVKSAPLINGFTYYEYLVPQGASEVVIQGKGNIDELRMYPSSARMKTITYDALLKKNSESDENNRIVYYEYDAWGRILIIRDDYRNVIKMYEYNTKQ